jgi:hypothetical protein
MSTTAVPPAAAPAAAVPTNAEHFAAAASAHGYDTESSQTMVEAAASLGLALGEAADWLDNDITPWGASTWVAEGFATGAEARPYRRDGYTPEGAYWARRDQRGRDRVERLHHPAD